MAMIPYAEVSSFGLYPLGSEDNMRDATVQVLYQDLMRNNLPYPNGCYDNHMGTTSTDWSCGSCIHEKKLCPGHYGGLQLNSPVPSPMFMKDILKWLKIICFDCGKPIISYTIMRIPKHKILAEYVKLTRSSSNKNPKCVHCNALHPHIIKETSDPISIIFEIYEAKSTLTQTPGTKPKILVRDVLYPHLIRNIFDKITNDTVLRMGKPIISHPRKLIIDYLRVPPNTIRPDVKKIATGRSNSNDLTILLQTIVKINDEIPTKLPMNIGNDLRIQIHNLSLAVFDLIHGSNTQAKRGIVSASKKPLTSIAKRWPRKFGRIRRNLMGRRSNHMGRSFITGDPFRKINEISISTKIARNIQRAIKVREYNYEECMVWFMNGVKRYPGCTKIKKASTGAVHWIEKVKDRLEIGDEIYRDIITGDIVEFNRAPSLQPSNISSMKVVVKEKGDTIGFNVLSCNLFNSDFDGDSRCTPLKV